LFAGAHRRGVPQRAVPILPCIERMPEQQPVESEYTRDEILHIRHHSLFAPRDFDLSPYFQVVKPTIESAFDPHKLRWADRRDESSKARRSLSA
jgi:hypothetical protein